MTTINYKSESAVESALGDNEGGIYVAACDKYGDHFDELVGIGTDFYGGRAFHKKPSGKKTNFRTEHHAKRTRLNADISELGIDLTNPRHLQFVRQKTGLPDAHISRLEAIDFRIINDVQGTMNCYYCTLAAFKGITVTELYHEIRVDSLASGGPSVEYIVNLYQRAGFADARLVWEGTPENFLLYLDSNLRNGESTHFSLAFLHHEGTKHVVHARAWKDFDGSGHLLTAHFQQPHARQFNFAKQ